MSGPLVPPQYAQVDNYGRTAMVMPFDDMPSSAAAFHTWVVNLETHLGTSIEVLSLGLPNDMSDPTSDLQKVASCPQAVIWAMPGTPNGDNGGSDGSDGSIAALNAGDYDSLIDATATAFVNQRAGGAANAFHGEDWVRAMWEFDYGNYTWSVGKTVSSHTQTVAEVAQGFDRIHTRLRAGGYTGKIMLNAGVNFTAVFNALSRQDLIDAFALDIYNNTGVSGRFDWPTIWANETLPRITAAAAAARTYGKKLIFPEGGCEVVNDQWHSRPPNSSWWSDMVGFVTANADVCTIAPAAFNQSIPSGNTTKTADDALFYCAPSGAVATSMTALGSLHSTSYTSAWTDSASPYKAAELADFHVSYIAGTMQIAPAPVVPGATRATAPARRRRTNVTVFA